MAFDKAAVQAFIDSLTDEEAIVFKDMVKKLRYQLVQDTDTDASTEAVVKHS